jgi:AraC-like DNA-binding protein
MTIEQIQSTQVFASFKGNGVECAAMQSATGAVVVDAAPNWILCVPIGPARITLCRFNEGPEHSVPLAAGTFGVLPPGHTYSARLQAPSRMAFIVCWLERSPVQGMARPLTGFYQDQALARSVGRATSPRVSGGSSSGRSQAQMLQYVFNSLRGAVSRSSSSEPGVQGRVEAYVAARIAEPISITQMAHELGCSAGYLSRRCHDETGCSPFQHVMRIRLERAKLLLEHTRWSMGEIAAATGYCDQSHFATVFRRNLHVSPSRYRAAVKSRSTAATSRP